MRRRFKLRVLSGTNFLCKSCFSLKRRLTHVLSDSGEPATLHCNLIMQNKPCPISCEIMRAMKLLFLRYRTSLLALQSQFFHPHAFSRYKTDPLHNPEHLTELITTRFTHVLKIPSRNLHVRGLDVGGHRHQDRRAHCRGNSARDNRRAVGSGKARIAFKLESREFCTFLSLFRIISDCDGGDEDRIAVHRQRCPGAEARVVQCELLAFRFFPSKMLHENMPPDVNCLRIHWRT